MNREQYRKTVNLLLEALPHAIADERIALKGGTAINLFHRNFPRFSVDIDLCYLPLEDRASTFKNIHEILQEIKNSLEFKGQFKVHPSNLLDGKKEVKLVATKDGIGIKIEPNYILRSSLFSPVNLDLAPHAVKIFEKSVNVRCLNVADTYGGKICAALDRQHPRDLFDVKILFDNEGITRDIIDSFIFYLISHNRPVNELLRPNIKDLSQDYKEEFVNMAKEEITLGELEEIRGKLISQVSKSLSNKDKLFLISFVSNHPDWSHVRDDKIKDFPSIKWKLFNQEKMDPKKKKKYIEEVEKCLT